MAKRTRYKKSVRQLYSEDKSLSNLGTQWLHWHVLCANGLLLNQV
jgi:hypothetical protein